MDETRQERAIEALRDWSKWLIGLNFAAATGCVIILQNASGVGPVTPFLLAAIASFVLSVFSSTVLVRELARIVELLPLRDHGGEVTTVFEHKLAARLPLDILAKVQLAFLGVGVLFFIVWVVIGTAASGS